SEVLVKLNEDGTANLYSRSIDVGQGSNTVLSQILAEELGIEFEDVRILAGDTETSVADLGAWASRQTLQTGNAVKMAGAEAKRQLFEVAAQKLDLQMHEVLEARGRRIYVKGRPDKGMPFTEAVLTAQKAKGGMPVMARGAYTPRDKGLVSSAWSFGAQAVELAVDKDTGVIRYEKITTAHDGGTAINPALVEGQLQGSAQMSLGWAYTENLLFDQGRVLNPNFRDYKVLTAADVPAMESIMVETCEPEGPYGAKEAGEGLTLPTGGAVANAVFHASGFVVRQLPIKPEEIVDSRPAKE
ncbi:MAG: molybdopterin-dependent oxidoreductase, partial [Dehalococcoidia bacterium]|nr:molybdopterin-dependent oxidoreductase [Dehalococcoidia bacterium]